MTDAFEARIHRAIADEAQAMTSEDLIVAALRTLAVPIAAEGYDGTRYVTLDTAESAVRQARLERESAVRSEVAEEYQAILAEAGRRFASNDMEGVRLLLCDMNARENAAAIARSHAAAQPSEPCEFFAPTSGVVAAARAPDGFGHLFSFRDRGMPSTPDGFMLVWDAWKAASDIESTARAAGKAEGIAEAAAHLRARAGWAEHAFGVCHSGALVARKLAGCIEALALPAPAPQAPQP